MEQRVRDLGGSHFDATVSEPSTISFEFANLEAETAKPVFGRGLLDFREPSLSDDRKVLCRQVNGSEFQVESLSVTEGADDSGHKEAQCLGPARETGTVVWEAAMATDAEGEVRQLTEVYIDSAEVRAEPGMCVPACVLLEFTDGGTLLFEQITTRLVNYPLGFFLDDRLLTAPSVRSMISSGQTIITGLSVGEAKTLAAQLNSGPLPVPVKLEFIEELTND